MPVNDHRSLPAHQLPGLEHRTLAGSRDGLQRFEVWRQKIDAGASTPVHRHDCEEVIVILSGRATCRYGDGSEATLESDQTLILPPNVVHQICNTGDEDLHILATLSMAPVAVETETGESMPLPWD